MEDLNPLTSPGRETSEHAITQDVIAHAKQVQIIAGSVATIAGGLAAIPALTIPAGIVAAVAGAVATVAMAIPMMAAGKYAEARATVKAASVQTQAAVDAAMALKEKIKG